MFLVTSFIFKAGGELTGISAAPTSVLNDGGKPIMSCILAFHARRLRQALEHPPTWVHAR
jgi:hypothetical protein